MKRNLWFVLIGIVLILGVAFYLSYGMAWSTTGFILIWIVTIIVMHLIITPLVVTIVRSRDRQKAAQEDERSHEENETMK